MNNNKYKNFNLNSSRTNGGYAILFAVIMVSIIAMISVGLVNTTYKHLILSSLASDSEVAFYQSDIASECALYADVILNITNGKKQNFNCGKDASDILLSFKVAKDSSNNNIFNVTPTNSKTNSPCFNFDIIKTVAPPVHTTIFARGYNLCDSNNIRTVERSIKVDYD